MSRLVGKIINTHGIKGDLKIEAYVNNLDAFLNLEKIYLDENLHEEFHIIEAKFHKKFVLLRFKGMEDINLVERYKGNFVYVDEKSSLAQLEEDEYYEKDLIDIDVFDENMNFVGKIVEVINNPTQDVLGIEFEEKVWYIPFVDEFIIDVDLEEKRVVAKIISGMI